MVELRRFGFFDFVLLVAVVALAAGARAGYLITCCDKGRSPGPLVVEDPRLPVERFGAVVVQDAERVQGGGGGGGGGGRRRRAVEEGTPPIAGFGGVTELDDLVRNIATKEKIDLDMYNSRTPLSEIKERSAFSSPGYPLVVGTVARYVDADRLGSVIRWGQCALGALTAGLYFLFSRRAFASLLVATLAGIFCALHPFWVIDTALIEDGVLSTFLLAAVLFFGARGSQTSAAGSSLLYGILLAFLALVRAALLPFAAIALLWFLLRSRVIVQGWLSALLAFLGFVIGFTPWMVYTYQRLHEVVPIVDSTYAFLWAGNHRDATGGAVQASDWTSVPEARGGDRKRRYVELGERVEAEVRRDQVETVRRRLAAGLYFFIGESWFRTGKLAERVPEIEEMPEWLARSYPGALEGTLFAMLLLGALGWRWTYGWRFTAMPSSLAVMWIPVPYILGHAEALAGPRLPLDGVLLCYSAFALCCLMPRMSEVLLAGYRPVVREVTRR
jgi:hypothetical protein